MKPALHIERRPFEHEEVNDTAGPVDAIGNRFLAVLSHELKQPLAELMLHADELLHPEIYVDARPPREIAKTMQSAVMRQARIIDDLFELSRMRTGRLRLDLSLVDLAELTRAACSTAARGAPRMQVSVKVCHAEKLLCMVDPVRVGQILSNLLSNAIKFSNGEGRIEVELAIDRGHARISVTDTGCGIASGFLPHVFSLFAQESSLPESGNAGMGIGLALVRELAIAHGGEVVARSEGPGRGAQFIVWLPLKCCAMPNRSMVLGTEAGSPAASTLELPALAADALKETP